MCGGHLEIGHHFVLGILVYENHMKSATDGFATTGCLSFLNGFGRFAMLGSIRTCCLAQNPTAMFPFGHFIDV